MERRGGKREGVRVMLFEVRKVLCSAVNVVGTVGAGMAAAEVVAAAARDALASFFCCFLEREGVSDSVGVAVETGVSEDSASSDFFFFLGGSSVETVEVAGLSASS